MRTTAIYRECKKHGLTEYYRPYKQYDKGECKKCVRERSSKSYRNRKAEAEAAARMITGSWSGINE